MSLRKDATELSKVLNAIVARASSSTYPGVSELAVRIAPNVARFERAVCELCSRDAASAAISDLADDVDNLSYLITRGELDTFDPDVRDRYGDLLDRYWRLYTVFRESRYRDQTL